MGGTEKFQHYAVLSSFVATMEKVSRAAAGGASFWAVPQPFKYRLNTITITNNAINLTLY